jgi:hypothetical protein
VVVPDAPSVWVMAAALAGIMRDADLLDMARGRLDMVDALRTGSFMEASRATLYQARTLCDAAAGVDAGCRPLVAAAHELPASPRLWSMLAQRLVRQHCSGGRARGAAGGDVTPAPSAVRSSCRVAAAADRGVDAAVFEAMAVVLAAEARGSTAAVRAACRLYHAHPSPYAWRLLQFVRGGQAV